MFTLPPHTRTAEQITKANCRLQNEGTTSRTAISTRSYAGICKREKGLWIVAVFKSRQTRLGSGLECVGLILGLKHYKR